MAKAGEPSQHDSGGLTGRAASGVAWTLSHQWLVKIFGFVTVAILARLLSPQDFGMVAVALSLLPLVQLLADLGFSTYLVQARSPTRATFSTAFWYSSLSGVLLTVGLVAIAPAVAALLGTPDAAIVIQSLAPVALIVSVGAVPNAVLRRNMRFRAIAVQSIVAGVAGQVVAIALALAGFGFWALIWQAFVYQTIVLLMAWVSSRWSPALRFSPREFVTMLRFGVKVIGADFVAQARVWGENAIVVAFLGVSGLGYLSIAQRLVQIAHDLTTNAVTPVSVVLFSRIRDTADRLLAGYLRTQFFAHALVVPIMLVLAIGAGSILPVFFGPQWEASVGPGQLLAIAGIFTMSGLDKGLLLGLGRPGVWLGWVVVVDAATVAATLLLAASGLSAIAAGFLAVAVLATIARWIVVARVLGTRWYVVAAPLVRVLPAAAAAAAAGFVVSQLAIRLPDLVTALMIGLTVLLVYVPIVRWTVPSVWGEITAIVGRAVARVWRQKGRGEVSSGSGRSTVTEPPRRETA